MIMRLTVLGSGTSYPDPSRVQSGILVETKDFPLIFDVGSGILHRLIQTSIDLTSVQHVFFTHFHIDHSLDFMTLYQTLWLLGYDKTLNIYGPPNINEWYSGLFEVSFPYLRDKFVIRRRTMNENDVVYIGNAIIKSCPTLHGNIQSRAFKIEKEGRSIVYSGDTAPCQELIELAHNADILVHECNWLDGDHRKGVHTSPSELTEIIEKCQPKRVILTHLTPEVVKNRENVVSIIKRRTNAEILLGHDLMSVEI